MKICVQGLWHLGSVTSACLASIGHQVIGFDLNESIVANLNNGKAPIFEPELDRIIYSALENNLICFVSTPPNNIDFLWVTYDTPVDEDDNADVNFVMSQIEHMVKFLSENAIVLISSQMPVGSIKKIENYFYKICPEKNISFAYSPENLRLGNAINIFLNPDRIVVGIRSEQDKNKIQSVLSTITDKIEWMSVESAEMTKHAINAFLATSVVFANEIATICEITGADAKEVERGLKTEQRIGLKAYLSPGVAFSGGTLARDIEFLKEVSGGANISLLSSVKTSNDNHKLWIRKKILQLFQRSGNFKCLDDVKITVWGITYKAGTDTLRRSLSVELCNWLLQHKVELTVHDPVVKELPTEWLGTVNRSLNIDQSLESAQVLIIETGWDEYKNYFKYHLPPDNLIIIDPNRYVAYVSANKNINYISVGTPLK